MIDPAADVELGEPVPIRPSLVTVGAITLVSRVTVIVISALLGVLTARLLGPQERGIYLVPSISAGLVTGLYSGLGTATTYFMLTKGAGRGALRAAAVTACGFVLAGALTIAILTFVAHQPWAALPAILSLIPTAIMFVCTGYMMGRARVISNTVLWTSWTLSTAIFVGSAMLFIGRKAPVAIAAWIIAISIVAVIAAAIVARDASGRSGIRVDIREFASYAAKIGLTSLVSMLNYRVDVYLVALFTKPADLAIYTVAVAGAETVGVFTQVVPQITIPEIGSLDLKASALYAARCARTNVALAVLVCGGLFLVAPWIITLLYGAAFEPATTPMRILLIGAFAIAPCSLMTTFFTIRLGRPRLSLTLVSSSALLSALLSLILIPRMGINGAAIATSVSYVFNDLAALVIFGRYTGIGPLSVLLMRRSDIAPLRALLQRIVRRRCAS